MIRFSWRVGAAGFGIHATPPTHHVPFGYVKLKCSPLPFPAWRIAFNTSFMGVQRREINEKGAAAIADAELHLFPRKIRARKSKSQTTVRLHTFYLTRSLHGMETAKTLTSKYVLVKLHFPLNIWGKGCVKPPPPGLRRPGGGNTQTFPQF